MTMGTQQGVDLGFSSVDLTLKIDDFRARFIEPAMSALASTIEANVIQTLTKDIYNAVGTAGTTPASMLVWGQARQKLNENLAPQQNRNAQIDSATSAAMIEAFKGLNSQRDALDKQYVEGYITRLAGFDWYENESIYAHTNGSDVTGVTVNDTILNGESTMTIAGCSSAPTVGSIFTMSTVLAVHPETKRSYSSVQQFVVTSTVTPTSTDISFSPPMYSSGPKQNVNALPTSGDAIVWLGGASTAYSQNLAYNENAFAFVSADLEVPKGMDMASIQRFEGISMRFVRWWDGVNDDWLSRIDVLYGMKTLRAQLACRVTK